MHPLLVVLASIAGLVAFSLAWDRLFYVDPRDPQRRVRWRRNASADDQAIRCVHCVERIESRADLYAARNRYVPITREMLHARCARQLARTGHWKARPAGSWRRHVALVTAMWVVLAAVGSLLAPGIVRNGLWIPLAVAYAALLGQQLVFYLSVARRLPKTRGHRDDLRARGGTVVR